VDPILIWFLVGTTLALLEFAAPGVVLIFFGIGAWAVAVTTWAGLTTSLESQLLLFAFSSVALLVLLRRWIKGRFLGHVTGIQNPSVNLDEFTGKTVTVLQDVIPGKSGGEVEFKGSSWSAVTDEKIEKGEMAVITSVDGLTLKIGKK
jgi:membrane protein implicated in regulation of membrane protease activity